MSINEENIILNYLYRKEYNNDTYLFRDLIKEAILHEINKDLATADAFAESKLNKLWSLFKKEYETDLKNNIVPLFDIVDNYSKTVKWIGINGSQNDFNKRYIYMIRPKIYRYIDSISDRQYEALACVLCKHLGAENIFLTPKGNEGGIDFIANIRFSTNAHYLFGTKGPIRIIGQCKKYATKDNIGHMKEFIQTMDHVYNLSYRPGEILPHWFKSSPGLIVGWHISHFGHQSGALDLAKNYGIITSNSKDVIDIISKARLSDVNIDFKEKVSYIDNLVTSVLNGNSIT